MTTDIDAADARTSMRKGLRYLASVQGRDGEFPIDCAFSVDMTERRRNDPCFFGTVAVAATLLGCAEAAELCARAGDFIERERRPGDLWGYYKKGHRHVYPPRDVDDSALATLVLRALGRRVPDNRRIILGNRDTAGRFLTWILPWRDGPNLALMLRDWRQALYGRRYRAFFANSFCERDDVDAGINANVLAGLGRFDGDERVVAWLLAILREGREASCDRYYDDPVLIRYFFSRALVGRSAEAGALLVERAVPQPQDSALHVALAILTRLIWQAPVPADAVRRLIAMQDDDGSWPIASLYCGGRPRLADGTFGTAIPDIYRKGSEAFTTAFCVAALDGLAGRAA